jgi:hypothetical protein
MQTPENDSWESRIEQVAKVIGKTPEEVETILDAPPFKITSDPNREAMLADEEITPFGDLRKMFTDDNGVTLPQLRLCMKILRGPKGSTKATEVDSNILAFNAYYGIETKPEDLDIDQLLPYYDPKKRNTIHDVIKNRYESSYGPVIAFKPNTDSLAIDEIIDYVDDCESGLDTTDSIEVDGELVRLYYVGQIPNERVDEDPLFSGQPLRKERSTVNRLNWKDVNDRVSLRSTIKESFGELKQIFPEAYLEFKELKANDELPKLKISMQDARSKVQSPFNIRRNRRH